MNFECVNGHTDEVFDGYCDRCGADLVLDDMLYPGTPSGITSFFDMIKNFFQMIIDFIKGLFN